MFSRLLGLLTILAFGILINPILAQDGMDPYLIYDSSIYIDPGSGEISTDATVEIGGVYGVDEYITTSVETAIADQNGNGSVSNSATDTCGGGCAEVYVYSSVGQLDMTYSEFSDHYGDVQWVNADGWPQEWSDEEYSGDSYDVPPAPSFSMTIDPANPNSVVFTYNVSSDVLYSASLQINGGVNTYTASTNPVTFTLDQNSYPLGQNTFQMYGYMYGFQITGPSCVINVSSSFTPQGTLGSGSAVFNLPTGGDGIAFSYTSVTHYGWDSGVNVSYCIPSGGAAWCANSFHSGCIGNYRRQTDTVECFQSAE